MTDGHGVTRETIRSLAGPYLRWHRRARRRAILVAIVAAVILAGTLVGVLVWVLSGNPLGSISAVAVIGGVTIASLCIVFVFIGNSGGPWPELAPEAGGESRRHPG